jgi:aspartyl-tRNA(Asn)/glutamyl-tRNA(Gln) amidotransferase subunit C
MPLTPEIVRRIADLARLELNEMEIDQYCGQLSAILDYAARLQTIDTTGIPPTSSVLPPVSILRADVPLQGLAREDILKIAPRTEKGQYRVPPILE